MPVEAQWLRARSSLTKRDKRVLAGMVIAAVIATIVGVAFAGGSSSPSNASCVVVDVPSTMGGVRLRQCGPAARGFCRDQGPKDATIAAACLRQGYAVPDPR
jgi:hypothetical protein